MRIHDALYRMNDEVDFIDPSTTDLSPYKLILVPALYAASDAEIDKLNTFAKNGGHLLYTFKSGFSDENVKVRSEAQPGRLAEAAGIKYNQFTLPVDVSLEGDPFHVGASGNTARWWMELLTPTTATVLAKYHHPAWGNYAAVTRNTYGKGEVTYVGFMPSDALAEKIVEQCVQRAGLEGKQQALHFPTIMRGGTLNNGHPVHYVMNYTPAPVEVPYALKSGKDLLTGSAVHENGTLALPAWGVAIVEEDKP